jgi:integrase
LNHLAVSDAIVFHGASLYRPIDNKVVLKRLYRALHNIGISEPERRGRNLTFHSWRHFLNSHLRSLVTDTDLQKLTGHRTVAMTDHYDHETEQTMARVRPHQANLIGIDYNSIRLYTSGIESLENSGNIE